MGLPGSGKSTLAAALAERLPELRVLDRDEVRHALFDPCDYSAAERTISFSAMLDAARYHLGRGRMVALDGLAFPKRGEEKAVAAVAEEAGAFVATVVCDVPVGVAMARADADAGDGGHPAANRHGDVVRRVAAEMREPAGAYLTVDTHGSSVEDVAGQVLAYLTDLTQ